MSTRSRSTFAPSGMVLWEIFGQRRAAFLGLLAALAGAVAIATISHFVPGSKAVVRGVLTACGVILTATIYGLFNFTHLDKKTGQAGFPTRLFVLPVSTRTLVTLPMLGGAIAVSLFFSAWWLLVLRQFGMEVAVLWPALVLAVTMLCFQTTLWALAAFRTARLLALSLGGTTLAMIAIIPVFRGDHSPVDSLVIPSIVMSVIGLGAYLTALFTVERQRHAGGHGAGVRKLIERARDLTPMRSEPFESAAGAQLWYEMRYAMFLPLATLGIVLFLWIVSILTAPLPPGVTVYMLAILLFVPMMLGGMIANGIWTPDRDLPTLVLIRPVSNGDLIFVKGKATLVALLLSWLVLSIFGPMWLLTSCDTSTLEEIYGAFNQIPFVPAWVLLGILLVYWIIQSWIGMLKPAVLALSGRPVLQNTVNSILGVAFVTLIIILCNEPKLFLALGRRLIPFLPFIAFLLNLRFISKLLLAERIGSRSIKRGILSEQHVRTYCIIWVCSTLLVTLIAFIGSTAIHAPNLPRWWIPWIAVLLALSSFPLVRMLLAARLFARMRHG
jgi:hypothetical protein